MIDGGLGLDEPDAGWPVLKMKGFEDKWLLKLWFVLEMGDSKDEVGLECWFVLEMGDFEDKWSDEGSGTSEYVGQTLKVERSSSKSSALCPQVGFKTASSC